MNSVTVPSTTTLTSSAFDHRRNPEILSSAAPNTTLPPLMIDNNSVIHQQIRYPSY
jgi:hypothetical protein